MSNITYGGNNMRKRSVMKNSVVFLLAVLLASASLLPSVAGSVHSYFLDNEKRTTDSISSPSTQKLTLSPTVGIIGTP